MPIPRVRFTVRRLMVAAAILALTMWGASTCRRLIYYRQRAALFAGLTAGLRAHTDGVAPGAALPGTFIRRGAQGPNLPVTRELATRWIDYYEALARKYEAASARPWLPVPPDPPLPE
jgi:hypothetical protein